MKYNKQLHNIPHLLKSIIGNLPLNWLSPKDQLIVLNYHGTQKKFMNNFKKQIEYYKKHYKLLSPSEFEEILSSKRIIEGRNMLITFDDGVKNNLYAIQYLNSQTIKAYFFVVPGFIETPLEKQKSFFLNNIRPNINSNIDCGEEDFMALSWNDLKEISKIHSIGSHTQHHTMTKNKLSEEQLFEELVDSKLLIQQNLDCEINAFCSINNTFLTVGEKELKLISENYKYHFSTFGGINFDLNPYLIERINVESYWMLGAVKFALSSLEFKRWKNKIEIYRELIKKTSTAKADGFRYN